MTPSTKERSFGRASLETYRQDLNAVKALDRDTERELAQRWIRGDEIAGAKIVEGCLPFVISVALEYRRWGVPLEDIVQQGNLGLLKAAKKFDPAKECRLATYAAYWIRAEIREYVVRAFRVVRLGTTKGERRALRAYRRTKITDPAELASISGITEERARELLPLLGARESSLDAPVGERATTAVQIAAEGLSPEDEALRNDLAVHAHRAVRAAVAELDERERMIIEARLMTEDPPTLQELGTRLGVSKERVRQIEERARAKLRGELGQFVELVA